jgi:hypothetical protein
LGPPQPGQQRGGRGQPGDQEQRGDDGLDHRGQVGGGLDPQGVRERTELVLADRAGPEGPSEEGGEVDGEGESEGWSPSGGRELAGGEQQQQERHQEEPGVEGPAGQPQHGLPSWQ